MTDSEQSKQADLRQIPLADLIAAVQARYSQADQGEVRKCWIELTWLYETLRDDMEDDWKDYSCVPYPENLEKAQVRLRRRDIPETLIQIEYAHPETLNGLAEAVAAYYRSKK